MTTNATNPEVVLHVAGRTDIGLVREHNEDSFVVVDLATGETLDVALMRSIQVSDAGVVMLVCDGMGGAAAGEIASAMAVETVREVMMSNTSGEFSIGDDYKENFAYRLRAAAFGANQRIFEAARMDPDKIGMGTTMTAVGVIGSHLVIAQVGDSRAYLWRQGVLTQVTRDQSLLNELLDSGQITEAEAHQFEHSNVILQALGVQPDVEVLLSTVELRRGDRLVVCSDGLTSVVTDEEVGVLAVVSEDVAESCRHLVDLARGAGGPDNITAIVGRFDGADLPEPSDKDEPVRYERWFLGDEESGPPIDLSATQPVPIPPLKFTTSVAPDVRHDFAQTFFSAMLLFAIFMGTLILGHRLRRPDEGVPCTVIGTPGLAIYVDGFETGLRTRPGGTELVLSKGEHRVRLYGRDAAGGEQTLSVMPRAVCLVRFDAAP